METCMLQGRAGEMHSAADFHRGITGFPRWHKFGVQSTKTKYDYATR